jgi:hypothetical protein
VINRYQQLWPYRPDVGNEFGNLFGRLIVASEKDDAAGGGAQQAIMFCG